MHLNTITALLNQPAQHNARISGVCIDSRVLCEGNLFVAIKGDQFDGHLFIKEAEIKGAVAAVVSQIIEGVHVPQILVSDTVDALAKIAMAHRQTMRCPVIALTGSNGKTTVKEMISAILPPPSWATQGNLNNHLGVPLSALRLKPEHRYAVFELGANHQGEIARTVAVVQPDVTLINNVAPAHIEGFGSIEGVARAKGEIHQGLAVSGTAVINEDDRYAHFWDDVLINKKVLRFSAEGVADVYALNTQMDGSGRGHFTLVLPNGRSEIQLQVPGEHNVRNALAAAACCYAVGISIETIQKGLNHFGGVKGRLTFLAGKNQSVVIDDTYNANLRSVLTALQVLARCTGKKIFVFGDMGELGEWAKQHHQEVGLAARELGIDQVLTCGAYSGLTAETFGVGATHFPCQEEVVRNVLPKLEPGTTVLVKGSRSSAMEKVVHQLLSAEAN